jgi:hypothetical protein
MGVAGAARFNRFDWSHRCNRRARPARHDRSARRCTTNGCDRRARSTGHNWRNRRYRPAGPARRDGATRPADRLRRNVVEQQHIQYRHGRLLQRIGIHLADELEYQQHSDLFANAVVASGAARDDRSDRRHGRHRLAGSARFNGRARSGWYNRSDRSTRSYGSNRSSGSNRSDGSDRFDRSARSAGRVPRNVFDVAHLRCGRRRLLQRIELHLDRRFEYQQHSRIFSNAVGAARSARIDRSDRVARRNRIDRRNRFNRPGRATGSHGSNRRDWIDGTARLARSAGCDRCDRTNRSNRPDGAARSAAHFQKHLVKFVYVHDRGNRFLQRIKLCLAHQCEFESAARHFADVMGSVRAARRDRLHRRARFARCRGADWSARSTRSGRSDRINRPCRSDRCHGGNGSARRDRSNGSNWCDGSYWCAGPTG